MPATLFRHIMRTITLTIFFAILISGRTFCQDPAYSNDITKTTIKFSDVILVDSASRSTLYSKAREWFSKRFKSAKAVLDLEDKENGKLIGKANFTVFSTESANDNEFVKLSKLSSKLLKDVKENMSVKKTIEVGTVDFTILVYVKDGRYKYEISNAIHKGDTQTVLDYKVTIPNGGDITNLVPDCGYNEMMPRIRWQNIKTNSFNTIAELIADLKKTMVAKDEADF